MKFYLLATLALYTQAIKIQIKGDGDAQAELGPAADATKPAEEIKAEKPAEAKTEA